MPVWQVKNQSNKEKPPLAAAAVEQIYLHARDETVEYVPVYDGDAWELYQCRPCDPGATQMQREQITGEYVRLDTYMKERIRRFLAGYDDDSD